MKKFKYVIALALAAAMVIPLTGSVTKNITPVEARADDDDEEKDSFYYEYYGPNGDSEEGDDYDDETDGPLTNCIIWEGKYKWKAVDGNGNPIKDHILKVYGIAKPALDKNNFVISPYKNQFITSESELSKQKEDTFLESKLYYDNFYAITDHNGYIIIDKVVKAGNIIYGINKIGFVVSVSEVKKQSNRSTKVYHTYYPYGPYYSTACYGDGNGDKNGHIDSIQAPPFLFAYTDSEGINHFTDTIDPTSKDSSQDLTGILQIPGEQ